MARDRVPDRFPDGEQDPGQERERAEALCLTGLSATADPGMERFARLVARFLDVPVALVSLLEADRQVFPGMVGLAQPWGSRRQTPLSHSFCRSVVTGGQPLVITDVRLDPRTCTSPAIPDLDVIGYAGMPLTDADGHVLGSLCAIDRHPREWTEGELADLADLTAACSAELRLRILTHQTERARDNAELLLRASVELARCTTPADVVRSLRGLFEGAAKPAYVGLLLADEEGLLRVLDPGSMPAAEPALKRLRSDRGFPSVRAMAEQRTVFVPDRETLAARFPADAVAGYDAIGVQSALCVPLARRRGVLVWSWTEPHRLAVVERATLTAVAGYVSQAVERVAYVADRISAAEQLQAAMLTELPSVPGLEMTALYVPAADQDMVGGDWYDAYLLPVRGAGGQSALMVSVGDIIGHDLGAAAVMGQVRSMLRQATLGHARHSPAAALAALDRTFTVLPIGPGGTLVHARLEAVLDGWRLTWSNAGHPPPLLRLPDGSVVILEQHDLLLLASDLGQARNEHECDLPPGSVLLLYTDGLVERRHEDIDERIRHTAAQLSEHGGRPLPQLLDVLAGGLDDSPNRDDVAVIALRIRDNRATPAATAAATATAAAATASAAARPGPRAHLGAGPVP